MDLIRRITFIMITLSLLNLLGCKTPDDSDSMQPFEGYPFLTSIEEIKGILKYRGLDTIEFRKGETIADIGAGNGYIEAMLSMFHDSLTFYININNRIFLNKFYIIMWELM